jgi:hypothetical protein
MQWKRELPGKPQTDAFIKDREKGVFDRIPRQEALSVYQDAISFGCNHKEFLYGKIYCKDKQVIVGIVVRLFDVNI